MPSPSARDVGRSAGTPSFADHRRSVDRRDGAGHAAEPQATERYSPRSVLLDHPRPATRDPPVGILRAPAAPRSGMEGWMRRRAGGAAWIALLAALLVAPVAPAPPVVVASTVSSHAQPAKTGTQAPRWAAGRVLVRYTPSATN